VIDVGSAGGKVREDSGHVSVEDVKAEWQEAGRPLLMARGVHKRFGQIRAVGGMDIQVGKGEVVGLIGPNGAGKTTFFNVIAGWFKPESGIVLFKGEPIHRAPSHRVARKGLVRTFQLTRTLARMTVLENMMLAPQHQAGEALWPLFVPVVGRARVESQEEEIRTKAEDLLETFELSRLRDEYAGALSGGQRKLLELARVLMLDPQMVLLDEPTAGVNPTLAASIMRRMQELRKQRGITVLLIEHDMETVMNNCERVVVMAEGRPLAEGTPEQIKQNPAVIDAYLGVG
jgi:ABC-type branched-subunit amino acid transport system ATPase component